FSVPVTKKPGQSLATGEAPADGGYPGGVNQQNYLRASPGSTIPCSSGIAISECSFRYFIVGVLISPIGISGNRVAVATRDCGFSRNKIPTAFCATLNRCVGMHNISSSNCPCVFSGALYGGTFAPPAQGGPMDQIQPIQGGQVGSAKYIFNLP